MNLVRFAAGVIGLLEVGTVHLYGNGAGLYWASFQPRGPQARIPMSTTTHRDSIEEAVSELRESLARWLP